jgi:thioredoxin 1
MSAAYADTSPSRAEIDALQGPALLEFGSPSCGHCRRLGRYFDVKLWPTLVFLVDGQESVRLVRPVEGGEIERALEAIDPGA